MSESEIIESHKELQKPFPIAAIGASAGGLEAITQLLTHLPEKTGIAYVYIQHLDPSHESNLTSILQRKTKMSVLEAVDHVKIEPDHVYIIPPNKEMAMIDGELSVSPRPVSSYIHMPINRFFISLAEHYKENAIGIVLSGTANDGTIGLKAIKAEGGITIVQDGSAKFQSMPQSAIKEGVTDLVLSPQQISEELTRLSSHKKEYDAAMEETASDDLPEAHANILVILEYLESSLGVDFSNYKLTTIKRRIIRRMILFNLDTYEEYLVYLKKNQEEIKLLYQDLLINVTGFFRDKDCCDYLLNQILPKIIKSKSKKEPIRIWVPACSTGQEAYTIAMMVTELLGENSTIPVQIFATDLSDAAITKARLGVYKIEEVAEVSQKDLHRYFKKVDGSYHIIKSLRNICVFASHNVIKDAPFSRLDIISCCNLLIYLNNNLQRKVLSTFHYSLNPDGYLILGKSESVSSTTQLFNQVDKKIKLYTKKKDPAVNPLFNVFYNNDGQNTSATKKTVIPKVLPDISLEKTVEQLLLKKYIPACVLVNTDLDILQFYGSTGLYLEAAPGRASLNLLKMARSGLGFELRNLVHKSKKTGKPEKKQGIELTLNDKDLKISVEAVPVKNEVNDVYFLIVFEQFILTKKEKIDTSVKNARVLQLEDELSATRDDMKSLTEAQEAVNEELQSANEEIVSSNEELQSINEELETSKEEIESSNEELMTMNDELQVRNALLEESQEYAEAILFTVREAIIILDYDYRIKTVNHAFTLFFNIPETEVEGKLLYEISNKLLEIPELINLLDDIVRNSKEFRDFKITATIAGSTKKTLLLNARKMVQKSQKQQLILLAIEDITGLAVHYNQ